MGLLVEKDTALDGINGGWIGLSTAVFSVRKYRSRDPATRFLRSAKE